MSNAQQIFAPTMAQHQIDGHQPARPSSRRYRLKGPGTLRIGNVVVTGPQDDGRHPSQLVWMNDALAAEFGDLVELAS